VLVDVEVAVTVDGVVPVVEGAAVVGAVVDGELEHAAIAIPPATATTPMIRVRRIVRPPSPCRQSTLAV